MTMVNLPPEPQGRRRNPDYQQVDSLVNDVPSLLEHLKKAKAVSSDSLDVNNLKTWLHPEDNKVAFWTPNSSKDGNRAHYDALTYAQLQQEMEKCPAYFPQADGGSDVRVGIVLPAEEMAHTATALLAIMAQSNATAVPLGPTVQWGAIQQLRCQFLVLSSTIFQADQPCFVLLQEKEKVPSLVLHPNVKDEDANYAQQHLHEIRVVEPGVCGRLKWSIYRRNGDGSPSWSNVLGTTDSSTTTTSNSPKAGIPSTPVLLLRTSGTTAQPKVVPITRSHLFYAAKTIATTLELTPHDCCVNAMPLFHIGGISCNLLAVLVSGGSVLLQGPFHDPLAFLGHITTLKKNYTAPTPCATWYYASPSMHKAIALVAQAQPTASLSNHLRFLRSATAHMPHDLALQLSRLLDCEVVPTYGMSEAMPICSSVPIRHDAPCAVIDSVGHPTGSSIKIVDPEIPTHPALPYGQIGEICVQGAGVITHYENLESGFTPDGWLMTGDLGTIDKEGRLFIKGRRKELIKRGGEQIWPNQVDSIIQNVPGVATAVTFGVPNPLFGEEVATAVVPMGGVDKEDLRQSILQACKQGLEPNSIPQQIKFLPSTDCLLKGCTGKYMRSKMADHLQLQAVDTGALRMLEAVAATSQKPSSYFLNEDNRKSSCSGEATVPLRTDKLHGDRETPQKRVIPHESLNGLRFLVSCFVLHTHTGLFPNVAWIKLQSYIPNMMLFFFLGVFQTTCSVARPVKDQWATWVGTKIGTLHALFVISQVITLPSYIVWSCTDEQGEFVCEALDYVSIFGRWIVGTTTGLIHGFDGNYFAWFLSTYYLFLIFFPWVDDFLRRRSLVPTLALIFAVALSMAMFFYLVAGAIIPSEVFDSYIWLAQFSMVSWGPYLIATMCAAYFFRSIVCGHAQKIEGKKLMDPTEPMEVGNVDGSLQDQANPDSVDVKSIKDSTKCWGHVCDGCSLILLGIWITVATYSDNICLKPETFQAMRGMEELEGAKDCNRYGFADYLEAKDVTYEEFLEYVHPDLDYVGRFYQTFTLAVGYWKMSAPLIMLWIFSMAFGNGMTSHLFGHWIMTSCSPLAYPLYLLHNAVARYYWLATRGLESKYWWIEAGTFPFPVAWYEYFVILGLTLVLGVAVTRWLVPILMPYTIAWGVAVCSWISDRLAGCLSMCRRGKMVRNKTQEEEDSSTSSADAKSSVQDQIESMVLGLTGVHVTNSTELRTLGLDSLGATALLGMLRASVPAAKKLSLKQLQSCETVGDLVNVLTEESSLLRGDDPPTPSTAISLGVP